MSKQTIYTIHNTDPAKLASVIKEMQIMGAPKVRVVDCGDYYMALEGSHRVAAAAALGLTPDLVIFAQDQVINITGYDWYDKANWSSDSYTAGEVAGELYSSEARAYKFDSLK